MYFIVSTPPRLGSPPNSSGLGPTRQEPDLSFGGLPNTGQGCSEAMEVIRGPQVATDEYLNEIHLTFL